MAVNTRVGRGHRKAINDRFKASPTVSNMMHQLIIFWVIQTLCVGVGITAAVVDNWVPQTIAYGVGITMATICVGKRMLAI